MPTVAELKALVKSHAGEKPKLSAGKEALLLYCEKAGLLKKSEPVAAPAAAPAKEKNVKFGKSMSDALPVELVKPAEAAPKKAKASAKASAPAAAPAAPAKKAPSGFAVFMSANKGSGMKMSELAAKYKELKN
jgi:hypothetical protein